MAHNEQRQRVQRGTRAPEVLRVRVARLVDELGARGAAQRLKLSRQATIAIVADQPVLPGTIALAERSLGIEAA